MEFNSAKKCFLALLVLTALVASAHAEGDWASKWNYTTDGGVMAIAMDDIDADGFQEVATATTASTLLQGGAMGSSSWLYVLDQNGNEKWSKGASVFGGKITSLMIGDLEDDGSKEVIVGSGSNVHFFDEAGNAEQKINVAKYEFEVLSIVIADVNNDKVNEMVVAGRTSTEGAVYIYNNKKQRLLYTPDTQQKISAFYAGDLNGDGKYEFVAGTNGKWDTDPAFIYEYDSLGNVLWTYKTQAAVMSLDAKDIDGDNIIDVLAGGKGYVYAFDGVGTLKKSVNLTGANVNKLVSYDLDKDEKEEIIAGGNFLYVLDRNFDKKWLSNSIFTQTNAIKFYDLNSDTFPEIILAANGVHIFSKDGREIDSIFPQSNAVKDFVLSDLNGDDYPEIVLGLYGASSGRVHAMGSQHMASVTNVNNAYKKASELLNSGKPIEAEEYARQAITEFKALGDKTGEANGKDLLTRIVAAQTVNEKTKNDADTYYNKAISSYTANKMADALSNAKIARAKYLQINDAENVKRCNNIINPATERVTQEAADTLSNAQNSFDNKQFKDAFASANKSLELFTLINDANGTQKSRILLQQIEQAGGIDLNATNQVTKPEPTNNNLIMWLYCAAGFTLTILVYTYLRSKKKKKLQN